MEAGIDRGTDEPLDVGCSVCGACFCFGCKQEAHRPVRGDRGLQSMQARKDARQAPHLQVSCELVRQWITKNSAESENVHWIIANTKPCPKCRRPIEKNQGCMHMTCSQVGGPEGWRGAVQRMVC